MDLKSCNVIQSWGTLILKIERLGYCTLYGWNCTSNHCSQNSFGGKKVNKHSNTKKTTRRTSKLDDFYGSVVLKFKPKMRHFCAIFHSGILNVQQHSHVCFFWYLEDIIFRPVSTFFFLTPQSLEGWSSCQQMTWEHRNHGQGKRFLENHQGFYHRWV